ncbi:hypothetical protein [Photorhabdus asymbiotica]
MKKKMEEKRIGGLMYIVFFVVWLNCANISHDELKIVRQQEVCIFCRYGEQLCGDIGSL